MKNLIFVLLALLALSGCSKSEHISEDVFTGLPVQLSGVIADATRAGQGVVSGAKPNKALSMHIFRADQNTTPAWTANYETTPITGSMAASSGTITLDPAQFYLPRGDRSSRFIGVYPTGTPDIANKKVTYTLDGAMDVMCSNFAEGSKGTSGDISMTFEHLLTQIVVKVKNGGNDDGEKAAIPSLWGNVTSIRVKGRATAVVLTLPDPNAAEGTAATGSIAAAANSNDADLALTKADGTAAAAVTIPGNTDPALFGYAMFLPVTTAGKLSLDIVTQYSPVDGITVETSNAQTFEAGKAYELVVSFTLNDVTLSKTEGMLTDWASGGNVTVGNVQ